MFVTLKYQHSIYFEEKKNVFDRNFINIVEHFGWLISMNLNAFDVLVLNLGVDGGD